MIVAPGAQFTQRDYEPFAAFFQQQGYFVITFDYRGVGDSGPDNLKGFEAKLHQWAVQDTDAVIRYVKNIAVNQELIFIGHGVSGEVVGLAQASQYISRLVLASSSLSCKRLWTWRGRIRIAALKTVGKLANKLFGYFPGKKLGVLRDLPKGVVYEWADWCDHPNGLFDVFPENNYRKLQVPLIAFSFSNDWRTPDRAVEGLLQYFSGACVTWYHVTPHNQGLNKSISNCFFDARYKSNLWPTLQRWLQEESKGQEPITIKPLNLYST
jgi:predicted alpha/beta hydrolase